MMRRLVLVPVSFRDVRAFVAAHHRHNRPVRGMKFAAGAASPRWGSGRGSRGRQAGGPAPGRWTDPRSDSVLHRRHHQRLFDAVRRDLARARALGYSRLITYTRADEPGAGLRAAGWHIIAQRPAHAGWGGSSRPRDTATAPVQRTLWEAGPEVAA